MIKSKNAQKIVAEFKELVQEANVKTDEKSNIKINVQNLQRQGFEALRRSYDLIKLIEIKRSGTGIVILIEPYQY